MLWKAAYNLLFLNPKKKASVPGMSVLFTRIADLFPGAPFFYLSTSPWNVESSIRNFITDHGFPEGPLLLRDLDPRPKTFVPSGPQHKLEFAEQLMADFPDMKFILVGDDGQKDPTTYATIAHRYPGRVLAIAIRQLSPKGIIRFGFRGGPDFHATDAGHRRFRCHRHHRIEYLEDHAAVSERTRGVSLAYNRVV